MDCWEPPAVFSCIKSAGNINDEEMLRTFNNGIGMILVVRSDDVDEILLRLNALKEEAFVIGEVESKDRRRKQVRFTNL